MERRAREGPSSPFTATLDEVLEAAGWVRRDICHSPAADLWTDPLDAQGRPWFGRAALLEEFRRRELVRRPKAEGPPSSPSPVEPPVPPAEKAKDPGDAAREDLDGLF